MDRVIRFQTSFPLFSVKFVMGLATEQKLRQSRKQLRIALLALKTVGMWLNLIAEDLNKVFIMAGRFFVAVAPC